MNQIQFIRPVKSFNNFVDGIFTGMPSLLREDVHQPHGRNQTPVNISEAVDAYIVELVAPGFMKEDFVINLEKNQLTVSAERKKENDIQNVKKIRQEFQFQSFSRSFTVNEKIDASKIVAKYVNGVLTLNLPRITEVKEAGKKITIE